MEFPEVDLKGFGKFRVDWICNPISSTVRICNPPYLYEIDRIANPYNMKRRIANPPNNNASKGESYS
jgi:hypothetical protein